MLGRHNKIFFGIAVLLASFLLVVWMRVKFIRTGYELAELRAKSRALELELGRLDLEASQLKSATRLAATAAQKGYALAGADETAVRYLKAVP
ncbi:MAG: hypothetical protein AABZ44_02385 [Elusimicrobiota bacterium]